MDLTVSVPEFTYLLNLIVFCSHVALTGGSRIRGHGG